MTITKPTILGQDECGLMGSPFSSISLLRRQGIPICTVSRLSSNSLRALTMYGS